VLRLNDIDFCRKSKKVEDSESESEDDEPHYGIPPSIDDRKKEYLNVNL
jgi:hypothetical protein